jgi:hypothetical protein
MTTGILAGLIAVLALGFAEAMRKFYPSRATWARLRSKHGRRAIWAMRRRLEEAAASRAPRLLAAAMVVLVAAWLGAASLLDKRWYEVVADTLPYAVVAVVFFRTPGALRAIAVRMERYERELGEDPERDYDAGDGGPAAIAL